jgi:hypothetical protein
LFRRLGKNLKFGALYVDLKYVNGFESGLIKQCSHLEAPRGRARGTFLARHLRAPRPKRQTNIALRVQIDKAILRPNSGMSSLYAAT